MITAFVVTITIILFLNFILMNGESTEGMIAKVIQALLFLWGAVCIIYMYLGK